MKRNPFLLTSLAVTLATAGMAFAQSGTLDQESPNSNASFNLDASSLIWQAQVRAGTDGQLEGISMYLTGTPGSSQVEVAIGLGDAWSSNIVFSQVITLQTNGTWQFIDTTSANIQLLAGETFVIQTHGNDTGMGAGGSYIAPPGDPLYAEPLWLNQNNFADGGWRHAFRSYMLTGPTDCITMTVDTLIAGQNATWNLSGITPGATGAIVYGFNAGSTVINGTAGYCATFGIQGVNQNKLVGLWTADGSGSAQVSKNIPNAAKGLTLLTQAAQQNTCPDECMSNLDTQVVQ